MKDRAKSLGKLRKNVQKPHLKPDKTERHITNAGVNLLKSKKKK
jgi:hypothetical protein